MVSYLHLRGQWPPYSRFLTMGRLQTGVDILCDQWFHNEPRPQPGRVRSEAPQRIVAVYWLLTITFVALVLIRHVERVDALTQFSLRYLE